MFPLESFQSTLRKVVRIFDTCDIGFHLTGGVTSIAYGEPRMTQDVDIVIDNARVSDCSGEFLDSLRTAGFLFDEAAVRHGIANKSLFQVLDVNESLKLDIYPRELIAGELSRSERIEVFEGVHLPVASLPDAAVSKLIWVSKGSHKNRRDLRSIVARATHEQSRSITELAKGLALDALLNEVLAEPDEID